MKCLWTGPIDSLIPTREATFAEVNAPDRPATQEQPRLNSSAVVAGWALQQAHPLLRHPMNRRGETLVGSACLAMRSEGVQISSSVPHSCLHLNSIPPQQAHRGHRMRGHRSVSIGRLVWFGEGHRAGIEMRSRLDGLTDGRIGGAGA